MKETSPRHRLNHAKFTKRVFQIRRTRQVSMIITNDEKPIGVNLGYDFCAEHEGGIRYIASAFGIPTDEKVWGLERRKITKVPSEFGIVRCFNTEYGDFCCLLFNKWVSWYKNFEIERFPELTPGSEKNLVAAWDESSFGILGRNDCRELLEQLYEAFHDLNIAIWVGYRYFGSDGLNIVIASEIPENIRQQMYESDKNKYELIQMARKTGIEELLKEHGKRWYALLPHWAKSVGREMETKYPVVFWLNPYDQDKYDFGYFTVEELRQWAKDEGPVLKSK